MKKRGVLFSLAAMSLLWASPVQGAQVSMSSMAVELNGTGHTLPAYLIESNNYVKLRDVAALMKETEHTFQVGWDGERKAISLRTGVKNEEEISSAEDSRVYEAYPSTAALSVDGEEVALKAYNIGGYTYFKLRELGQALSIPVEWRETDRTVVISAKETDEKEAVSPWEYQKLLGKGMDVDWSKTKSGRENYNKQTAKDFAEVGVSHVRIRISEDADEALLKALDEQIEDCLQYGLIPVIAYQGDAFKNNPNEKNIQKVVEWWGTVAERYQDVSPLVSFDLLIEATDALNQQPEKLNEIYERVTAEIRKTNPTRILMISPRLRSDAAYLHELEIPTQANDYLMAEWHFYAAGPSKTNDRKLWTTGTKAEKALIQDKIDTALAWQEETGIPTWVGAWMPGNYNDGNDYSVKEQEAFAKYMTKSLEKAEIPFAVNSDTKFYDREKNQWIKEMQPVFEVIYK